MDAAVIVTSRTRNYPLKEPLRKALIETGLDHNENANDGDPLGFAALSENWADGKRQPASKAYGLPNAVVHMNAIVKRIVIDDNGTAKGIQLLNGKIFRANKEVLVCCGSLKTPQLLMLSGIGPSAHLRSHGIAVVADLPVGQDLHDHLSATMFWQLRHPERELAIGSSLFSDNVPDFKDGNPIDWMIMGSASPPTRQDSGGNNASEDFPVVPRRGDFEFFVSYAPIASSAFFDYSLAATHITTPILGLLPTSRGTVTLASTDPSADPIIDPSYLATETDRRIMRAGIRTALRTMLDTTSGRTIITAETPPPGQILLSSSSTDEEIDDRLRTVGRSFYQSAGTAAMGKVVDSSLRVKEVIHLRAVDASIFPLPLAGHYQYPVYTMAECAADIILKAGERY